jgi:hypothetical protein
MTTPMADLPSIFNFHSPDAVRRCYASNRAVRLFGHEKIIECIELARRHETGAIRDYNADAFPVNGMPEQLLILRAMHKPLTFALAADEVPILKAWLRKGSPYALSMFPADFLDKFSI